MNEIKVALIIALLPNVAELSLSASQNEPANQQVVAGEYLIPAGSRTFAIDYVGKVSGVPDGTGTLRVWMPVPQDSTVQKIRELSFSQAPRLTSEPKYGNRIAYWELHKPQSRLDLTMKFVCQRKEAIVDLSRLRTAGEDLAGQF